MVRKELVECCFTSTETIGLLGTGAQDGHLDFHTAPELCGGEGGGGCYYTGLPNWRYIVTTRIHPDITKWLTGRKTPNYLCHCPS